MRFFSSLSFSLSFTHPWFAFLTLTSMCVGWRKLRLTRKCWVGWLPPRRRFRKVLERRVKVGPSARAASGRFEETDENHSALRLVLGRRRRSIFLIITGTGREWDQARPAEGVLARAAPFRRRS